MNQQFANAATLPHGSNWPMARLGDLADHRLGKMLDKAKNTGKPRKYLRNPNIRWFDFDLTDLQEILVEDEDIHRYELAAGDVLICEGGEAGRAAIWQGERSEVIFQKACHRVRVGPELDARFFVHRLMYDYHTGGLDDYYTGTTIKHFTGQNLARYEFPLPPLDEQRRIAAILDKADALRRKRKRALDLLDGLTQSIFLEMFGDPATNPNHYPVCTLREISRKISDGPFGSNLKSSHYVEEGVRVIRLQNIGVGKFIDDDATYISDQHFSQLSRHECLPGDVLVGTLGDPNLRACIQPRRLEMALNKADCVQVRVDPKKAQAEYVCALLNQPAVERMAQSLMLGQTRTRISMGRLRDMPLPIAPIEKQAKFVAAIARSASIQSGFERDDAEQSALFASLQSRAFSGQL